jgi:hypothetical protein
MKVVGGSLFPCLAGVNFDFLFRQVILGNQWASFGHIAAEVDLSR